MMPIPDPAAGPRLVSIPHLVGGGRWRVEAMRSLREPLLLWFTQGQGRIMVSGQKRGFGAHNALFIPPGAMHGFEVTGRVFGLAVHFGRETRVPLPPQPLHLRIRDATAQNEVAAILDSANREAATVRPRWERAMEHHMGLVGLWLERQAALFREAASPQPRPDAARRLTERFVRLVEREYRSGMGVAHYAAALGITPTHLSRACKAACGRPAHALLQDRVLYEARQLLCETRMPVKEVARNLGFNSPAYFTRAFQQQTGETPTAFRQRH